LDFFVKFNKNPPKQSKNSQAQKSDAKETPKQEAAKEKPESTGTKDAHPANEKPESGAVQKQEQKPKNEPKAKPEQPKGGKKNEKVAKPEVFGRLNMCVGRIVSVENHPDAESLYKEEIDLGEEKPRQVVSGLVKFVPIEEMRNRLVVVLRNLKAANMRGVRSEAMVICASNDDHTQVELLEPPAGSAPGDVIRVDGEECAPDDVINLSDKNNIFKKLQEELKTNDVLVATFKGKELRTDKGTFTAKTLKNCALG